MLNSEINPTRCNNCVCSSQWLYSTCFGRQLNTQHSEKQHGITKQWYLQLNTTDNDKTTRILTKLQYKYTCLPERPYTALYSWWWVELSPEACRVKPLRRINAIVASCWIYFTIMHFIWLLWLVGRVIPHRIGHVLSSSIALIPDILRLFVVFISLSNRILL